jgi:hypothetical protein
VKRPPCRCSNYSFPHRRDAVCERIANDLAYERMYGADAHDHGAEERRAFFAREARAINRDLGRTL